MFNKLNKNYEIDYKGINNLRGLAIDMINEAKSGHPGICLGAAGIVYTLFKRHMNIYVDKPDFINRDRFVFSAGHGVPLLYSCLYMLDLLTLDDLKNLRKINSKTPGHPEIDKTPFIEMSTGPLGQGVASSVGIALSEAHLNKKTNGLIDYYTYVLCGDGELEEGICYEALALAGKLKLNKLIVLYDSNNVQLDSDLSLTSNENIRKRFESINFNVIETTTDPINLDNAIRDAKSSNLPTVIIVKTIIGEHSINEGKNIVHGKPLEADDIMSIKEKLGLYQTPFTLSQDIKDDFKENIIERGEEIYQDFIKKYEKSDKELIDKIINKEITYTLTDIPYEEKSLRELSGLVLNKIAEDFPLLIGGSADLSSSCKTNLEKFKIFNELDYEGRNIYFGIREHAMAAILNGMALSGLRPFGSTFLTFSDYMRPSIRMTCLMNLPVLYIFTHDSLTVGEDGPAHHAIEQMASLDLIPNLKVYRPYDYNELIGCYKDIFENKNPSALILPRDNKQISENTKSTGVFDGIYVVKEPKTDNFINLISNGEELGIVLETAKNLEEINIDTRVISMPCKKNIKGKLKNELIGQKTIAITFGSCEYYYDFTRDVISISEFTLSGSKEELLDYFGFTPKKLQEKILDIINN